MIARLPPRLVWGALAGAGIAYEAWALRDPREGYTLSEVTRALFRVEHPAGKAAFLAGYVGFSAWFVPHIVRVAREVVADQR